MSLATRNPLFGFDNLLSDFFAPATNTETAGKFAPRVDILEKPEHYEIHAEMPGVKRDDVHVTVDNGVLSIEAELNQNDKEEKEGKVIRQERFYGKYARRFTLGDRIDEAGISANFKDGVLELTIPKASPATPEKRRIEIG